jgi:hypothetical protein
MTFRDKYDRACIPFTCLECGRTREQEQDDQRLITKGSLREQKCTGCRHHKAMEKDEQQRIQNTLNTGRIPKGTRQFIEEIETKIPTITDSRIKTRIIATIAQLRKNEQEEQEYHHYEDDDDVQSIPPVTEFTVLGTRTSTSKGQECPVCIDNPREYISEDGRILACEECARAWTKTTESTKWLKLQDAKNE